MSVDILSPLSNNAIATLDGTFDITFSFNFASSATVQCFCQNGSPSAPVSLVGSSIHSGKVKADLPSGKRDIFIKVDGVEVDREINIDVTIGSGGPPPGEPVT